MKLNSQSIAQALILVFLGIAGSSGHYANKLYKENKGLQQQATQAKADEEVQKNYANELSQYLTPDAEQKPISDAILELKAELFRSSVENSVEMPTGLMAEKMTAKGTISSIYEKVPGTEVTFVKFKIEGGYQYYDGLVRFLADIQKMPVSITNITVDGKRFEIGLKAYGK